MHANDDQFYEAVNQIVQEEPAESLDPETLGLLASIGIEKESLSHLTRGGRRS